jgi:hypothetical protein
MLKSKRIAQILTMMVIAVLLLPASGCKKDKDPARETEYNLQTKDVLGVNGTVTFVETSSTTTTIKIKMNGAVAGGHPAELCMNSMVEDGPAVITLNPVDNTGNSSTLVTTHTYNQLNAYDGFVKVMKSSSERNVILAMGDIGGNILTSSSKSYDLNKVAAYQVSGTALFQKRENGNTLVTISLTGTINGQSYPATINLSSTSTIGGGPVTKHLSNVDGTTGKSYTNIRSLDSGLVITYDNWLVYNGYINIYQSSVAFVNIISQGDIGSN